MLSDFSLARSPSGRSGRAPFVNLAVALVYCLGAWIGVRCGAIHPSIAGFWPPSGLALAALICGGGLRLLPGIAVGAGVVAFATVGDPVAALAVTVANVLEAWLTFALIQRIPNFSKRLESSRSVLGLLVASMLAPIVTSALIGPLALYGSGQIQPGQLTSTMTMCWFGNFLGILFITPAMVSWCGNYQLDLRSRQLRIAAAFLPLLALISFCVLDGRLEWLSDSSTSLYLILPFIVGVAMGEDLRFSGIGNLIVLGFAIFGLSRGHGPFSQQDAMHFQLFLAAVGITTLLVVSLSSERARALGNSQRNIERLNALTTLSADWFWETDAEHRFTALSDQFEPRSGLRINDALGKTRYDMPANVFESEEVRQEHIAILKAHKPFRDLVLRRQALDGKVRWCAISGEPIFNDKGDFTGYRGVGHDITDQRQATQQVEESRRFLDVLINAIDSPVLVKNESHQYIAANAAFCDFFARPLPSVLGKTDYDFFSPEKARYFQDTDLQALAHGNIKYESAYPIGDKNYWNLVRKSSVKLPDGTRVIVLVMMDVTERKATEERLLDSERRFRDFAQAAGDYAFEIDIDGRFTFASSRSDHIWGYDPSALIGRTPAEFMNEDEAVRVREWLQENQKEDGSFRDLQHHVKSKSGEQRWIQVNAVGLFNEQGVRIGQRGSARDITDRKSVEDRINFLATRDVLTGLPNRLLFGDRIAQAIAVASRTGQKVALFFMDLDRFKYINDTLGHDVGDVLLRQVAERMLSCIRKRDTLARLGGDEFVLALEGLQNPEDVTQVAAKIIRAVAQPYEISGHTLTTSCSIGISIYPSDAEDDRSLMKNADTAMYHAKERGRNNFQFFSNDMNTRAVERSNLEVALRKAVDNGDFLLHYQPRMNIRTAQLVGVEALLRWKHPEKGVIQPAGFIEVAEDCGLIDPIGQWALREACQTARTWDLSGYPQAIVAVNISPRQFIKPNDFARNVARILQETGFDPTRLELEVTESLLAHNADEIVSALRKLSRDGVRISVDDFGTGHSSLSYLRQFPIKSVKIDRTLVRDADTNAEHASVIQAIVAMGHSLDLTITAEGVETREQLATLTDLGCDDYQGNLFSRPLPAIDVAARFLAPGELDLRIS